MDNPIATSLAISVIGMTLLFLALLLFYVLLTLLASVARDQAAPVEPAAGLEAGSVAAEADLPQAAAVGVALARAEAESSAAPGRGPTPEAPPHTEHATAWWALHHTRRLAPSSTHRRPT